MGPILSPDATRVIYSRMERDGPEQLWMSAVAGGSPVRLVKSTADDEPPAPGHRTGIGSSTGTFKKAGHH